MSETRGTFPYYKTAEATTDKLRCSCGRLMDERWFYTRDGYPMRGWSCKCGRTWREK